MLQAPLPGEVLEVWAEDLGCDGIGVVRPHAVGATRDELRFMAPDQQLVKPDHGFADVEDAAFAAQGVVGLFQ
jgi:hypothetical protein